MSASGGELKRSAERREPAAGYVFCFLVWARTATAAPGSREPSRSGVSAIRLRSLAQAHIMCRSPEALARRAAASRHRYHCPSRGCLVNRSRDCTRSRVPPLRVGAML